GSELGAVATERQRSPSLIADCFSAFHKLPFDVVQPSPPVHGPRRLHTWFAPMASSTEASRIPPPQRCSLLVVDDEPYILDTLSRLLEKEFEVLTAPSADAAQKICEARHVHLILADQKMPGRTGVEFLEWVKKQSPKTIRLMMTGFTDFEASV